MIPRSLKHMLYISILSLTFCLIICYFRLKYTNLKSRKSLADGGDNNSHNGNPTATTTLSKQKTSFTYDVSRVVNHHGNIFIKSMSMTSISTNAGSTSDHYGNMSVKSHTQNSYFSYVLNEPYICRKQNNEELTLLVAIYSAPGEFEEREFIRQTWGKEAKTHLNIRLIFILGMSAQSDFDVSRLQNESILYQDVIQVSYTEAYRKIMLKSFALYQWIFKFCNDAQYMLKIDSDVIMDLSKLLRIIKEEDLPDKFICGLVWENAGVFRDKKHKYYVSREDYPASTYPTYCEGCAYLVSRRIAQRIANLKVPAKSFPCDDVFMTGILRKQLNESTDSTFFSFGSNHMENINGKSYMRIKFLR